MVDREKVLAVLTRRFPGASPAQIAASANAIVGLADEWEEVPAPTGLGPFGPEAQRGETFRLFRRKGTAIE